MRCGGCTLLAVCRGQKINDLIMHTDTRQATLGQGGEHVCLRLCLDQWISSSGETNILEV